MKFMLCFAGTFVALPAECRSFDFAQDDKFKGGEKAGFSTSLRSGRNDKSWGTSLLGGRAIIA
jgi:hypothetical protein